MTQADEKREAGQQGTGKPSLTRIVSRLAWAIVQLDPGSAAALRRGPLTGAGAAAFWKLMAEHAPELERRSAHYETRWAALLQAISILTPKGTGSDRRPAHEPNIPMGTALCDAGVSELRLARLLGAPRETQRNLAVRLCRRLSATERGRFSRFHLRTLANLILYGDEGTKRRIARDYYSRTRAKEMAGQISDKQDGQEASPDA